MINILGIRKDHTQQSYSGLPGKICKCTILQHSKPCSSESEQGASYNTKIVSQRVTKRTSGRSIVIFKKKLGNINPRRQYSVDSKKIQNTIFRRALRKEMPFDNSHEQGSIHVNKLGDNGNVKERCYSTSQPKGQFLSNLFLVPKKDGRESTSDKFKTSELLYSLPTFQDGGTSSLEGSTITKRFFMQTGSEGCILLHPNRPKVKEIYKICLGRKPLRIYVPVFRTRSSSFDIYKTSESSNISVTKAKRKGNSIFWTTCC